MSLNSHGNEILYKKPLINSNTIDLIKLRAQDDSTFGKQYINYMDSHGFNIDHRTPVQYIAEEDLAYVMTRYRQVHDFWHVLCDLPPTILGEIGLKWFEWVQVMLLFFCNFFAYYINISRRIFQFVV
jgi:ubiquinone biosynthesis protein COQ4